MAPLCSLQTPRNVLALSIQKAQIRVLLSLFLERMREWVWMEGRTKQSGSEMEAVGSVCSGPAPQTLCLCHMHRHSLYRRSPCSSSGTGCRPQAPLMLFTWMQPA